jgi:hypothetical protein
MPPFLFGETMPTQLFEMGRLMTTPGALEFCKKHMIPIVGLVRRHLTGDWGDLCDEDKQLNVVGIRDGLRILSAYQFPDGKIYIITEFDRSVTTVLMAEEY